MQPLYFFICEVINDIIFPINQSIILYKVSSWQSTSLNLLEKKGMMNN